MTSGNWPCGKLTPEAMELYLNERSFVCPGSLGDRWESVTRFTDLLRELKAFGVEKIVCPRGYKRKALGGVTLASCYPPSELLTPDRRNELITLMDSSLREAKPGEPGVEYEFSTCADFKEVSFVLGYACATDLPVVSLTFDAAFEEDLFDGYFREDGKRAVKVAVRNVYQKTEGLPLNLVPFSKELKRRKAEQEPMWNVEMVSAYLKRTDYSPRKRFKTAEEKQAYLIEHGTFIARLNGWAYHSRISALNSKKGVLRYIFYSAKFRSADTYLSIDLEHEDIRFELCDYDGCHLREIRWDGTVTDDVPKKNHNITV